MNIRVCFEGLKESKQEQIEHIKSRLSNLNPESRHFDEGLEAKLNQAVIDLNTLSEDEYMTYRDVAMEEVFYDCTESGVEFD
jgi:hypothetical protein